MVYSCGYPILHTFNPGAELTSSINYNIVIQGTPNQLIYTGELLPYDTQSTTVDIDISEVCRSYLDTFYEKITDIDITNILVPSDGLISTINTFGVQSSSNTPGDNETIVWYTVMYDYNTEYKGFFMEGNDQRYPDIGNRNAQMYFKADPRQFVGITGYAVSGSTSYGYAKNNAALTPVNSLGTTYQLMNIKLNSSQVGAQAGDTFRVAQIGTTIDYKYDIVMQCPNRYVLYYVNKYGGLDNLLCDGRYIQSWNPSRVDARLYKDRRLRKTFEQTRIYQDIRHQFELNTGFIKDEYAELIDHLIYSPKVWIHDLQENTITSCIILDTNYSAKRFKSDRLVYYTINVELSQIEIRQ